MKDPRCEKSSVLIVSFGLAVIGFVLIMAITAPYGLMTTTDSAFYYQAAKYFSQGDGFLHYMKDGSLGHMVEYPPLYSVFLSVGIFLGMDVASWARILHAGLLGVNVFLVSLMAFYLSRNLWAAFWAGVAILSSVQLVEMHMRALAEPLFFTMGLGMLWMLMRYVDEKRIRYLFMAALLSGACFMTRHAGAAMIFSGMLVVGWKGHGHGWKRFGWMAAYCAAALAIPGLWLCRNTLVVGRPVAAVNGFFLPEWGIFEGVSEGINMISPYFLPTMIAPVIRGGLAIIICLVLTVFVRHALREMRLRQEDARLLTGCRVVGVFILGYILTLAVILVVGPLALVPRYLTPLVVAVIPCGAALLCRPDRHKLKILVVGVVVLVTGLMALRTFQLGLRVYRDGQGYNLRLWTETGLVKTIKTLADDVPVYSNDPQAFYFYTGRTAVLLPGSDRDFSYLLPLEKLREQFLARRAIAVIFNEKAFIPHRLWLQVMKDVGLVAAYHDVFGSIYVVREAVNASVGTDR